MIRIIKERDADGTPTAWKDFREVTLTEVTLLDAVDFDDTDPALLKHLGVENYAEAAFIMAAMGAEVERRMDEIQAAIAALSDDDERDAEQARLESEFAKWMATDARIRLSGVVGVWASMRHGGELVSIADVMGIAPRDQMTISDGPSAYVEAKKKSAPGKG